jgi:hypothetical protein
MDINLKNISLFEPNKVKGYLEGILFKKWGGMVRVGFVENHNGAPFFIYYADTRHLTESI